ncbi:biopolymer transporter ExbD [Rubellicoccus peritrichatus]|uniref:Biopolymer transporter ExbD n=1 Tax=Rubellicoccus peritrichatus TaxID=3080537 RepID=A0AAQ3L577_9BACT|nr:biopolymer transporter ExbD [Puniceicoccus sp. CR14]WOO39365.1 biopolymer transporter ExbD [Puniceicoccus sp. CR14]
MADFTPVIESNGAGIKALRRRRRRKRDYGDDVAVDFSPLIDCVFLLLIFFLVATILKRLEKQIPVMLPDSTSSLAQEAELSEVVIALGEDGVILQGIARPNKLETISYAPIDDIAVFLKELAQQRGTNTPIRIDADRDVPFQEVIDTLDICSIQGFEDVGVRLKHHDKMFFEILKGKR